MRRSGVRIPSAPPDGNPVRPAQIAPARAGFSRCHSLAHPLSCPPGAPRRGIEPVQPRQIGTRAEEVQVPVRRRDRLVTHPRLDRSRVDPTGQPQARRRVPQVVDPPAMTCRRPLHRAQDRGAVQAGTAGRGEQQVARLLSLAEPQRRSAGPGSPGAPDAPSCPSWPSPADPRAGTGALAGRESAPA